MTKARSHTLAALLVNISAGWFGAALIAPALTENLFPSLFDLTKAILWGIITFEMSVRVEEATTL